MGAGMGGGSSDGATTLTALNEFFNLNLSTDTLLDLALQIGSDVPFFLKPFPCFANGRGEKLIRISLDIPYTILIINPSIHVSTKWAYGNITPKKPEVNLFELLNGESLDIKNAKEYFYNDFERPVFNKYPVIKDIKEKLYYAGAFFALMTGSGSTVFGIFDKVEFALKAKKLFPDNYFVFINEPYKNY